MTLNPYNVTNYADTFIMTLIDYSPKLISAFLILFWGFIPLGLSIDSLEK